MGTFLREEQHDAAAGVAENLQGDADHHFFRAAEMLRDAADFGNGDVGDAQVHFLADHLRERRRRVPHADIADLFQGVQLDIVQLTKGHPFLPAVRW